ncbi:mucin-2-like isoform X2 [Paramacrobiotus metropolitanus]|uniref:mucin-2-like isoform X2 n=1 Tax=Paramacrobiotus metropolitanus TaxID=2943436 RepID=UPI0024465800|nr:mucin-2-like isoform X2 [Paramacrobiotus metropolitanus]
MLPTSKQCAGCWVILVFVICGCICSDSPEPSKRARANQPDDPLPASNPPGGQSATHLHGHRLGGNDDAEGEGDDGENENESENNGNNNTGNTPYPVNARPAKSGAGSSSSGSAEAAETPIAPPPEPALPPLVVIGEPVQTFAGQLQHRPSPAVNKHLFAYHQKAHLKAPVCCGKKAPSPYSAPLTSHQEKTSISQVQLVSVAAPSAPLTPKQPVAAARIVNEKLVQVVALPVSKVQPNRLPPGENVVIGKQIISVASHPKSIPEKPAAPAAFSSNVASQNQLQIVTIASPGVPPTPLAAQPIVLLERQIAAKHIHAPGSIHPPTVPASPAVAAANHHATSLNQVQIVAVPGSPASAPPATPGAVVEKQVQIISTSVAAPSTPPKHIPAAAPAHIEKVTNAQQIQLAAIAAPIHPAPGKIGFSYLSPPSRLLGKQFGSVYTLPAPPGPSNVYPVQHATLGMSSVAYGPTHTLSHTKYRVADFHSPLVGSMLPVPPGYIKHGHAGHTGAAANQLQAVHLSQLQNKHYPQEPSVPARIAAKHAYPAALGEVIVSISKPPGLVIQPNSPAYPPPVPTIVTPVEQQPTQPNSPLLIPSTHVDPYAPAPAYPPQPTVDTGSSSVAISHNEVAITQLDSYISPPCAQSGLSYCFTDPDYPIAEINAYITTYPERYQILRSMVTWKTNAQHVSASSSLTANTASQASGEAAEPAPAEPTPTASNATEMCVSHVNPSAKLYRALNAHDKWKCIVHLPEAYQAAHCDTCDTNRTCKYVDSRIQSQCVQEFVLQQMMVYSPEFGLHLDEMKVPRGCQCRLIDTGSHYPPPPPPVPTAGSYVSPTAQHY